MLSITNFFNQFLFKFLTGFFTFCFAFGSIPGGFSKELPEAPDDFTPVVRFAVVSDIHLSGEEDQASVQRFADLFSDSYAYAQTGNYNKLDAVVVCGDMTNGGRDKEYEMFNKIVSENLRDGTELLVVMGNHEFIEYRDEDPTVGYTKYKQYINEDVDRHLVINGYHLIGVSYSDDAKTFKTKKDWLNAELKSACSASPDKPVFVFNHPHPLATVFGSVNWCDVTLRTILSKYNQVIDFSGHSHYAANDPRSIWQGSFTAVGTGSLAAQMSCLDYLSGGEDAEGESGCFWIVEADANGNVRLKLYDITSHTFFEQNDYYLADVSKASAHRYTWGNLKSLDTAPEFPKDAKITASADNEGNIILSYPDAAGYYPAESYKICVSSGALNETFAKSVDSNYVRAVKNGVNTNIGKIDAGTYTVTITPVSPYAKTGTAIKGEITVA